MNETENTYLSASYVVKQSVIPDIQLANGRVGKLRYDCAALWKPFQGTRRLANFSDKCGRLVARVPGNVIGHGLQIRPGRIGPAYGFSHLDIRRSASF